MFYPGQEVECIVDVTLPGRNAPIHPQVLDMNLPKKGERFTVRWCGIRPTDAGIEGVMLNEIILPIDKNWGVEISLWSGCFRAIQRTDISVLKKLCNPTPVKQLEDA